MNAKPKTPDELVAAAMAERQRGNLPSAADLLVRATVAGSPRAQHFNLLGNVLGDLGRIAEAEQAYARAVALDPRQADAWINGGNLLLGRDDEAACRQLRKATEVAPRSVLAWIGLGKALRALGQYDKAVAALEMAKRIEPARSTIPIQLGLTHAAAGRAERAIAIYDAAERGGQARAELFDNRAAVRIAAGDIAGAARDFDMLVERYPEYTPGHRARARFYWEYGITGDPFASYRELARRYPGNADVWLAWLAELASFRQYEAVADIAEDALRAAGEQPGVRYFHAVAQSELGRLEAASRSFALLELHFGQDPGFLTGFARHALRASEIELAERLCEQSIMLAPLDQLAWAYRGLAWRMLGDPREDWLSDYDQLVRFEAATPPGEAGTPEAFASEMAGRLRQLHDARIHPADQSLRGGTQTTGSLFASSEEWVGRLKAAARAAVARYIKQLPDDPSHPFLSRKAVGFRFSGSWSVRLHSEGFHIAHVHPQGWISSAFYFVVPEPDAAEPKSGSLALGGAPAELGLDLGPRRIVRPRKGHLCLFPSMVWHETIPFRSGEERLTVAFDAVPTV